MSIRGITVPVLQGTQSVKYKISGAGIRSAVLNPDTDAYHNNAKRIMRWHAQTAQKLCERHQR